MGGPIVDAADAEVVQLGAESPAWHIQLLLNLRDPNELRRKTLANLAHFAV